MLAIDGASGSENGLLRFLSPAITCGNPIGKQFVRYDLILVVVASSLLMFLS